MGYFLKHTLEFNSPVTEQIKIELYKKADSAFTVEPLICTFARKQTLAGNGDAADTILSTEFTFGIWLKESNTAQWDDFIVSFHDEWKVVVYSDGQIEFTGFLTPNEGKASLLGVSREVSLSATDNLGLLKKAPLRKSDSTEFREVNRLIDYACGALAQTGLQLNVIVYSNIYESSMPDRNADPTSDTFNQATLDYRMFMSDPLNFKDAYTSLSQLLGQGYSLEQYNGKWVIQRIGEMQGSAGPKIWYTEYSFDGATIIGSGLYTNDPAIVDKQQTLHPIDGQLDIACSYSIKRARLTYNYTPWPEIPKNNTFERGTFLPGVGLPGQKAYTIDDWSYMLVVPGSSPTPTTDLAYRLSTYNVYGVETAREVVLDSHFIDPRAGHRILYSSPIPVKAGDRIELSFDFKRNPGGDGTMSYGMFSVVGPGNDTYRLNNSNSVEGLGPFTWDHTTALRFPSKFYDSGDRWENWTTFSFEMPPMPISGDFTIGLLNFDSAFESAFYRNLQITYHPFVAGGYIEAKGDYWNSEQNAAYLDEVDEEVFISDSEIKVLQGALFRANGTDLTTRSWHRFNINENRGYKELLDIARYNLGYRRMWEISGTFGGIGYYPGNNQGIRLPLGFHRHFIFPGVPKIANSFFQLVPPLTVDYSAGKITANFRESWTPGLADGAQLGDIHEFQYKFQ
jgi:hypothetical protein